MKKSFKKSEVNFGCYTKEKSNLYLPKESFNLKTVLNADISLKDKAWFIRNNCNLTNDELRLFAIGCALCVLPIYESKNPNNKAPREAIEAAKAYLKGTISINILREKRRAAADAADADAAYAAAYAAADAAAYAADAAYAAYAAYAAADAADANKNKTEIHYKDLLLQFFKTFCKIK